ncbi:MAG: DnaJ domain-containing protein [Chloroherpetonaceae bacterium]|nr:DnaJ domain-containing protein [Chloroherpetonaceae bacterium]MCS7210135.1 DnaJ domain-containing protein [Chloroherpetonaceae bacterium]MDW8019873.1 DnaJ domain-containing protein [Chloroherpetonaceae bacterium]MDW8467059.1 DnaJ domain-containing protein [Chloroherpetonaceae bacterium]
MSPREFIDFYALLGVAPTATDDEIRRAYIERIKATHPDTMPHCSAHTKASAEETARLLNLAKETLLSPTRRQAFDALYRAKKGYSHCSQGDTSKARRAEFYRSLRLTESMQRINPGYVLFGIGVLYIFFASVGLIWRGVMTQGGVVRIAEAEPVTTLSKPLAEYRLASTAVAFAPWADTLPTVLCSTPDGIALYALSTGQVRAQYRLPFSPSLLCLSATVWVASDGARLAAGAHKAQTPPQLFSGHQKPLCALALSPDHTRFASAADDHTIKVWNLETGQLERSFVSGVQPARSLAYSPDGKFIAFTDDRWVKIWMWKNGAVRRLTQHRDRLLHVCCSPHWVASASEGGEIRQTHLATGAAKHLGQESGQITKMIYSPDYRFLLTANSDGRLRLYDAAAFKLLEVWNAHLGKALEIGFSDDGKHIYSFGEDQVVRIWAVPNASHSSNSAQLQSPEL